MGNKLGYDIVGKALLWTLGHLFGPAFTADKAAAWRAVYLLLADVMQEAATGCDA